MARRKELMPLSAEVLPKLRKKIYFEKTLPASAVVRKGIDKSELNLPSQFIKLHGQKIGERAILRYQSSIWSVKVITHYVSSRPVAVRFGSGWRDFVTFHSLLEGDTLLFSLIANSEFEVYLKGGSSCQSVKKRPSDFQIVRKKSRSSHESRGLTSNHNSSSCSLSKLHLVEPENKGDSSSGHHYDSQTVYESAMSEFDTEDDCAQHSDAKTQKANKNEAFVHEKKIAVNSQLPCFFKKLTISDIYNSVLGVPSSFWKPYSSRLYPTVKLQGIHEDSHVRTMVCQLVFHRTQTRVRLQGGWKKFVEENNLEVGQELSFTLTNDSFFVVREVLRPPMEGQEGN